MATILKLPCMNVKLVLNVLIRESVQKQKEIERCLFQKFLWKNVKYPIKISQLNLELNYE
ncbi:hypothetical protein B0I63_003382 [Clostridium beijerinckii]|uniref:Uncharacterized protein n=1 Tax=Clostridium beijerinckii TaxID=1520 RepID=A0A9Q5CUW2_CLOBE|nr:hypothetical protein CLBIJ_32020 [Clostridium beijerinckii]MBA2885391.1 hypothetical protein [Clostridium beijerinckii]MBA2900108.1 hypothetical protein [Clostridium beijerinckii]MBA2909737.1 hypothetical protein [Clostridium beijerinckii]MBA9014642.1 hypothetical protein [Clostridium beijerinckii]